MTGKEKDALVGIITFHCSNNFGAMLQAYGLKSFLCGQGLETEIVRYEPPYMTGRHWWIPYAPIRGLKGRIWCMTNMWNGFVAHMRNRSEFAGQRANMDRFRREYLVKGNRSRCLFSGGLKKLPYRYYVVGSDQIWNPDITCGLRKAYFGVFRNRKKEKVISYAASFGGSSLEDKYDREFAELVGQVDAVSVREESAVPYVQSLYGREVAAVLDPVFFLDREEWQKVEREPEQDRFIFLYITEPNRELAEYAGVLSEETGLPVVEVRAGQQGTGADFQVDRTAGPAEFLGYIHRADYVVSNSFHAVAFSIIYRKKFFAFAHRNLGARVRNILKIHGLEDRLYQKDSGKEIDSFIDWDKAEKRKKEYLRASSEFLLKNLT